MVVDEDTVTAAPVPALRLVDEDTPVLRLVDVDTAVPVSVLLVGEGPRENRTSEGISGNVVDFRVPEGRLCVVAVSGL